MMGQLTKSRRVLLQKMDGETIDVVADWRKQKPLCVNQHVVYLQDWNGTKPWVEFFMDEGFTEVIYFTLDEYQKYEDAPQWWILDGGTWLYDTAIGRAFLTPVHSENDDVTQWQGRITKNVGGLVLETFDGGIGVHDDSSKDSHGQ